MNKAKKRDTVSATKIKAGAPTRQPKLGVVDPDSSIDKMLSKFGPQLQGRIQQLNQILGSQKNKLLDMRYFGLRILEKAKAVKATLPKKKKSPAVAVKVKAKTQSRPGTKVKSKVSTKARVKVKRK